MAKVILPAVKNSLYPAIDFIKNSAKELGFDNKKIYELELASEEVIVNIINYAYPSGTGEMEITCAPLQDNKGIKVEVVDWGMSFNPLDRPLPNINAPIEEREIGGLGIYLLRKTMDDVSYRREDGKNILTFVKKL
ncbi:MAG: ATP-binding protein [Candidatus Omnitrophica bacterium]|nr:ATP-binding protein [Candidatus Omnitrophota bacterium]